MITQQWTIPKIALISLGPLFVLVASASESALARTDRYTLTRIEASSDQQAPLTSVITLSFGADIKTVGDAITELLQGSGYQWVITNNDQLLQVLPLPAVIRTLGPIRLKDALTTIAGTAWALKIDELHRTVSFELSDAIGAVEP